MAEGEGLEVEGWGRGGEGACDEEGAEGEEEFFWERGGSVLGSDVGGVGDGGLLRRMKTSKAICCASMLLGLESRRGVRNLMASIKGSVVCRSLSPLGSLSSFLGSPLASTPAVFLASFFSASAWACFSCSFRAFFSAFFRSALSVWSPFAPFDRDLLTKLGSS